MMASRRDAAVRPDRYTVETGTGTPTTSPSPTVFPAEDSKLRKQEVFESNKTSK